MSDIGPEEVQNGIDSVGFIAALGGILVTMFTWIFRRQIKRLDVIEERYVPNDRHEKAIEKLEAGMHDIEQTFLKKHDITHSKIDINHKELTDLIISLLNKD